MPGKSYAYAIANNNVCHLRWNLEAKLPGCLGFSIDRIPVDESEPRPPWAGALPVKIGFPFMGPRGETERRDTDVWPVQKFEWIDSNAPRQVCFKYRIVPMVGRPGAMRPEDSRAMETGTVCLADDFGPMSVSFSRGLIPLGDNHVTNAGKPSPLQLEHGHPTRNRLGGDVIGTLLSFLAQARDTGGRILAALHKLTDRGLIEELTQLGERVDLVLTNADSVETYLGDDGKKHVRKLYDKINTKHRRRLMQSSNVRLTNRFLAAGRLGHNNFLIHVDEDDVPRAVLTGSVEWTACNLCAETNNILVLRSSDVAEQYRQYWRQLKDEANLVKPQRPLTGLTRTCIHSDHFKAHNARSVRMMALCEGSVRVWFSPNCAQAGKGAQVNPPDVQEVFDLIGQARKSILFLSSCPGEPNFAQRIRDVHRERLKNGSRIYVAGATTDPLGLGQFVEVFHRGTSHIVQGPARAGVVGMGEVDDTFSQWNRELYHAGGKGIRDCVVVIDHLDAQNCVVVTGSHNLNRRSSCWNEENFVILRGMQDVALAFATHVFDVTTFYRWRWRLQQDAKSPMSKRGTVWRSLEVSDGWQDKYFDANDPAYHDAALLEPGSCERSIAMAACISRG
jgi:hypothetical protein